ncbi:hypothetical protein [Phytohabitans rumicis]|uniref:ATP/GTP-binding protein n=1 Tax=Phytohabitans rumicis TaxID=1076125 RepID=A0A6V8L8A2_9ACTN|nr:hypothetical protein [Phytohabitans rumicis]GFJ90346.1 hypothetical protein Prum_039880 [Phytohabitans rumicis]
MLTRRLLGRVLALAAALVVLAAPTAAVADPPIGECPPGQDSCHIIDDDPGDGGDNGGGGGDDNGGGGGERECTRGGEPIACYDPVFGWFNQSDECYYRLTEPQLPPPPGASEDGAWWTPTCLAGTLEPDWFDDPPVGAAPPDPETLARRALAAVTLRKPDLQIKPDPNGAGLVGLPVWLWANRAPETWGPISNSAEEAGLQVDITATVTNLRFDLGDGSPPIDCPSGGTPYPKGATGPSPDCGHVFTKSSRQQPGQKFTITATTTWTVTWESSGGESGTIEPQIREAEVAVRINELQVVTE